jgi:DNA-binding NarL/FixJ family response regulator
VRTSYGPSLSQTCGTRERPKQCVPPVSFEVATRVAIGEFAALIRLGLETALARNDSVSVVASNLAVPDLVTVADRRAADVIVVVEGADLFRVTALLRASHPRVGVLAVLLQPETNPARLFARGVTACVSVDTLPEGVAEASMLAAQGTQVFIPGGHRGTTPASVASARLTPRQTEVLGLLVDGKSYAAIAEALHISPHTVDSHVQTIFRTLHVRSRGELMRRLA